MQQKSKEEKEELIQLYKQSGMSVRAFAEEFELNLGTFRSWLYKKSVKKIPADDNCNFVEIEADKVKQCTDNQNIQIQKNGLEDFHKWLLEKDEREVIFGSSKTSEAIKHCLKNWDKLIKFLNYSFVTPDINAAERAIKPFVMARKNFLFSGSGKGAESSCFLFSLIETAKANDISLEDHFRCFF